MLRNINPIFLEGGQHTSERQYVITSFLSPGRGVSLLQNIHSATKWEICQNESQI
jgi:hypothetical protein